MQSRLRLNMMIILVVLFSFISTVSGVERLDRGLVAVELEDGSVFLSWRLLKSDPEDMSFRIVRIPSVPHSRLPYKIMSGDKYGLK